MILDFLLVFFVWIATYLVGKLVRHGFLFRLRPLAVGEFGFALVLGMATISCVGTWAIFLGAGANFTIRMLFLLALTCALVIWTTSRMNSEGLSLRFEKGITFENVFIALAAFMSMSPQLNRDHRFSLGIRIGPDAIGYGVGGQAVALDVSRFDVEAEVNRSLNFGDVGSALSAKVQSIYQIPSVTEQIRAEYLVGARRWGVLSFEGVFIKIFGPGYVWLVQAAAAGLGVFVSGLLISEYLRRRQVNLGIRIGSVLFITLSPALLNAWHEGGIAQVFTLPAIAILGIAFLETGRGRNLSSISLSAASYVLLLGSYNDAIFLIWVSFFAAVLIMLLGRQYEISFVFVKMQSIAFAISMILCMPLVSTFSGALSARSEDAGQGGWPQPFWPNLSDFLGVTNMFRNPSGDSTFETRPLAIQMISAVLLVWLLSIFKSRFKSLDFTLVLSALITLELLLIKTKYFDLVTNYQVAKASASLTPIIVLGMAIGIHSRIVSQVSRFMHQKLMLTIVAIAGLWAGISWHLDWKNINDDQTRIASTAGTESRYLSQQPDVASIIGRFDFVQPPTSYSNIPATFGDFHWINRGVAGKSVNASTPRRPIAIWLDEFNCPELSCLEHTKEERIVFVSKTKAILWLGEDSGILDGISSAEACEYLNSSWISYGGSGSENCFPIIVD